MFCIAQAIMQDISCRTHVLGFEGSTPFVATQHAADENITMPMSAIPRTLLEFLTLFFAQPDLKSKQ